MFSNHPLYAMLCRLAKWSPLGPNEQQAVLGLPHRRLTVARGDCLVHESDKWGDAIIVEDGLLASGKTLPNGQRQILAVHFPRDLVAAQCALLTTFDCTIEALTASHLVLTPSADLLAAAAQWPRLGAALARETQQELAIARQWVVNVGSRSSKERLAHLICESAFRLRRAGFGGLHRIELRMTQADLAGALGITAVHLNRVIQSLSADGLIRRRHFHLYIDDWQGLVEVAGFDQTYLETGPADPFPIGAGQAARIGVESNARGPAALIASPT